MDQWDRELAKAGIQMAGAAGKGMGNVMVAVIDGLIEKGVFSIEEVRDMLDRIEATVRRAEGEIEGDLAEGSGSGGDHGDRRPPPRHPDFRGKARPAGVVTGAGRLAEPAMAAGYRGMPVSRGKGMRDGDSVWPIRLSSAAYLR